MKTMQMLALGSAVAGASAKHQGRYHNTTTAATPNVVYTTEIVTALTTYCPGPTTITHGAKTYTVTSATTLTITDCPCTISKPVHPTGTPGDECSKQCYRAYNACRGKPGANMSYCAYEFASCLGYNPFGGDGSLITPTACSKTAASTQAPTQTATSDDCAKNCYNAYNKCRGAPGANFAVCGSQFASCLGYNPFTGRNGTLVTPTACSGKPLVSSTAVSTPCPTETHVQPPQDCAQMCYDKYNQCRGKPGANMSFCASQFAGCLGYNPFKNGTLVTPTACSKPAASSTAVPTNPVVPTQSEPAEKDCAKMCYDKYNMCRGKPGANMSFCASQFAGCLGYNPFDGNGSLVTPTACSSGTAATAATATETATDTATGVVTEPTSAMTEPTSAMTEPTSAVTEPTSAVTEPTSAVTEPTSAVTEPTGAGTQATGNPTGTNPPVTAGAGALAPAKILLALGAIALL